MFMENLKIFFENHAENEPGRLVPDLFLFSKQALFKRSEQTSPTFIQHHVFGTLDEMLEWFAQLQNL